MCRRKKKSRRPYWLHVPDSEPSQRAFSRVSSLQQALQTGISNPFGRGIKAFSDGKPKAL
jgi:hypothetical protein